MTPAPAFPLAGVVAVVGSRHGSPYPVAQFAAAVQDRAVQLAEGSDRPERLVEMVNAAGSPTFYEFDSADLLRLYREMDDRDEWPVVVYHSHTATEAYPSRTDVKFASEPNAHYVLISTRDELGPDAEVRSFAIVDGVITEEPVHILED